MRANRVIRERRGGMGTSSSSSQESYPMTPSDGLLWWIQFLAYAAFAAFGGFMGHLLRTMENGTPIKWGRALLESASAGFVGVLVLFVCQAMKLSPEWTGVIVGVSGWLGASVTIRTLEVIVRKRLNLASQDEEKNP